MFRFLGQGNQELIDGAGAADAQAAVQAAPQTDALRREFDSHTKEKNPAKMVQEFVGEKVEKVKKAVRKLTGDKNNAGN